MSSDRVLVTQPTEHITLITLNNPSHGNAVDAAMRRELPTLWSKLRADDSVRVVIITGSGDRHFCTGRDFKDKDGEWLPYPHLTDFWKPVLVAVNGVCAGSGHNFLWEADFAIASERASFTEPHVSIGWVPRQEMLGLATRAIPLGEVMQLGLRGKRYRMSAQRAAECGLVTEVVEHHRLVERAIEIATDIAAQSPTATRLFKEGMHRTLGLHYTYGESARMWDEIMDRSRESADYAEGLRAFAQGRPPRWQ